MAVRICSGQNQTLALSPGAVNARFQQSPHKHSHHKLRSSPQEGTPESWGSQYWQDPDCRGEEGQSKGTSWRKWRWSREMTGSKQVAGKWRKRDQHS